MNPITESSMVNESLVDDRSRELDGSSIDERLIDNAGADISVMRRLVRTLMLVVALISGGVFGHELGVGWEIEGGGRTLFFNPACDAAWTVSLGS